jgi:hypothetical protein
VCVKGITARAQICPCLMIVSRCMVEKRKDGCRAGRLLLNLGVSAHMTIRYGGEFACRYSLLSRRGRPIMCFLGIEADKAESRSASIPLDINIELRSEFHSVVYT